MYELVPMPKFIKLLIDSGILVDDQMLNTTSIKGAKRFPRILLMV